MPQPTPVWFIWQDDHFLIYTTPDAQKLRNLEQNNKVALGYAIDVETNGYTVVMGEASIDYGIPLADKNPPYLEKYRQGFTDIDMTPVSFAARFTVPICVWPQHIRGE
jgi:PPOX class probable F420-dependent enzyme